jgi:hypothetical protein
MVPLDQITLDELKLLVEKAEAAGDDPDDLREALISGHALFWRVSSEDASGLVITQERVISGTRELFVRLICGVGSKYCKDYLQETLEEFGRLRGAKRMSAVMSKASHRLVTEPLGYTIDRLMVSKEI